MNTYFDLRLDVTARTVDCTRAGSNKVISVGAWSGKGKEARLVLLVDALLESPVSKPFLVKSGFECRPVDVVTSRATPPRAFRGTAAALELGDLKVKLGHYAVFGIARHVCGRCSCGCQCDCTEDAEGGEEDRETGLCLKLKLDNHAFVLVGVDV